MPTIPYQPGRPEIPRERIVYKEGDTSRASTVSLADDPHLFMEVLAGEVHAVECFLAYDCGADGPSIQFDFDLGANPADTCFWHWSGFDSTTPANTWFDQMALSTGSTNSVNVSPGGLFNDANNPVIVCKGVVFAPSGADATLALRWAQNASNATATVLQAGSWMRLTRLT